ncbi:MAG: hypothetical protein SVR81_05395 [Chloroflexota bacterium]|nr:hypothetical protein [Chloroflexota bacterium]
MKKTFHFLLTAIVTVGIIGAVIQSAGPAAAQGGDPDDPIYYFPLFQYSLDSHYAYGLDGGTVEGVVIDPNDPNTIYANSWGAGIYKSTDGGETWENKSTGLRSPYIYEIAIDPENSDHILVSSYEKGVDESIDGGDNWHQTKGWPEYAVAYSIDYNPNDTSIVYAAIREQTIYDSNGHAVWWPGGVWKSIDGGENWIDTTIDNGFNGDYVYDLAIDPSNPNYIYTANHRTGVYKTTNAGGNWESIGGGLVHGDIRGVQVDNVNNRLNAGIWDGYGYSYYVLPNGPWVSVNWTNSRDLSVYEVQIDPNHPSTTYLTTASGVYRCENPSSGSACSLVAHSGDFVFDLAIDSSETHSSGYSKTLYTGLQHFAVHKSTDAGGDFSPIYNGIDANIVKSILVDPRHTDIQFISAISRGLFRTEDSAAHWSTLAHALSLRNINDIVYRPAYDDVYYVGDQNSGVYFTSDTGDSWIAGIWGLTRESVTEDRVETFTDEIPPNGAYGWMDPVDYQDLLDVQGGESLDRASTPSVTTLGFDPNNPAYMFAGKDGSGIVYSNNFGQQWTPSNIGYGTVNDSLVDPNGTSPLYLAGFNTYGVMRSTNRTSWTAMNTGLHANPYVYSLEMISPGVYLAGTNSGIYKWNGSSWIHKGLEYNSVVGLAIDPINPSSVWALVYNVGLYHSSDGGETWSLYPTDGETDRPIINTKFLSIEAFESTPGVSEFYIGSDGGGLIHFTP